MILDRLPIAGHIILKLIWCYKSKSIQLLFFDYPEMAEYAQIYLSLSAESIIIELKTGVDPPIWPGMEAGKGAH